jgi:hypothetical protein
MAIAFLTLEEETKYFEKQLSRLEIVKNKLAEDLLNAEKEIAYYKRIISKNRSARGVTDNI